MPADIALQATDLDLKRDGVGDFALVEGEEYLLQQLRLAGHAIQKDGVGANLSPERLRQLEGTAERRLQNVTDGIGPVSVEVTSVDRTTGTITVTAQIGTTRIRGTLTQ